MIGPDLFFDIELFIRVGFICYFRGADKSVFCLFNTDAHAFYLR